jgi:hypothetical protein
MQRLAARHPRAEVVVGIFCPRVPSLFAAGRCPFMGDFAIFLQVEGSGGSGRFGGDKVLLLRRSGSVFSSSVTPRGLRLRSRRELRGSV